MKPIVNIAWIYIIDVLKDFESCVVVVLFVSMIASIIATLFYIVWRVNDYDDEYEEDVKKNNTFLRAARKVLIGLIILATLSSLIPSEKTMYTMFIASYVTEENIKKTGGAAAEVVDYIFERIDELNEEGGGESND